MAESRSTITLPSGRCARWRSAARTTYSAARERAAAMYSLIGTTKLNGLDPEAYLRYVIERIADHPINRVEELLPWNVADILRGDDQLEIAA